MANKKYIKMVVDTGRKLPYSSWDKQAENISRDKHEYTLQMVLLNGFTYTQMKNYFGLKRWSVDQHIRMAKKEITKKYGWKEWDKNKYIKSLKK
jgi:hypothetical protein